jgi:hypothetical protein
VLLVILLPGLLAKVAWTIRDLATFGASFYIGCYLGLLLAGLFWALEEWKEEMDRRRSEASDASQAEEGQQDEYDTEADSPEGHDESASDDETYDKLAESDELPPHDRASGDASDSEDDSNPQQDE